MSRASKVGSVCLSLQGDVMGHSHGHDSNELLDARACGQL